MKILTSNNISREWKKKNFFTTKSPATFCSFLSRWKAPKMIGRRPIRLTKIESPIFFSCQTLMVRKCIALPTSIVEIITVVRKNAVEAVIFLHFRIRALINCLIMTIFSWSIFYHWMIEIRMAYQNSGIFCYRFYDIANCTVSFYSYNSFFHQKKTISSLKLM